MLQNNNPLIMNWFAAKGSISRGALEVFNLNTKLATRKTFGFYSKNSANDPIFQEQTL